MSETPEREIEIIPSRSSASKELLNALRALYNSEIYTPHLAKTSAIKESVLRLSVLEKEAARVETLGSWMKRIN